MFSKDFKRQPAVQVVPDSSGFSQRHLWSSCHKVWRVMTTLDTVNTHQDPPRFSETYKSNFLSSIYSNETSVDFLYSQAVLPNGLVSYFHGWREKNRHSHTGLGEFGIISPDFIVFWCQSTISTLVYTCWSLKSEPLTLWCEKKTA